MTTPHQRAIWRSALLNAARHAPASGTVKLPLGREPSAGSPDWAHGCRVPTARLVPVSGSDLLLHALGLPRPRTASGWPMPFAATDPDDPCATDRDVEILCSREGRCQVCGLSIPPGTGFAVRRPTHPFTSLAEGLAPWVEGRAALHQRLRRLRGARLASRKRPGLVENVRWRPLATPSCGYGECKSNRDPVPPTRRQAGSMNAHDTSLPEREWNGVLDPLFSSDCPHRHVIRDDALNPTAFAALRSELLSSWAWHYRSQPGYVLCLRPSESHVISDVSHRLGEIFGRFRPGLQACERWAFLHQRPGEEFVHRDARAFVWTLWRALPLRGVHGGQHAMLCFDFL